MSSDASAGKGGPSVVWGWRSAAFLTMENMDLIHRRLRTRLLTRRRVTTDGCWEYTRACDGQGYGRVKWRGKHERAHRLSAYLWLDFDLDGPLLALHRCDNPPCFRPTHLYVGTQADNVRDRDR